jgi:hypothetical protein
LIYSVLLALLMALHAARQLLERSAGEPSWLWMIGFGVSVAVGLAALGLFLRTLGTQVGGLPLPSAELGPRSRSMWLAFGVLILCLFSASIAVMLARLVGIGSDPLSQYLDSAAAVWFPVVGSLTLVWLLRYSPARRTNGGTPHR